MDFSIQKTPHNLRTSIYRKPTFTDSIIPYTSNHPTQHKYTAVKYLYHRLNSYGLQEQEYKQELNVIHNILHISTHTTDTLPQQDDKHDKYDTTTTKTRDQTQMGNLQLHRQRNIAHHQRFETHTPKNSIPNQKHHRKSAQTEEPAF